MAISYFPLSVNVAQIVGTPVKRARLLIETNLPKGTPLAYGSEMVTPGGIYDLPGGVGEITLPTTAGLTNVSGSTLQYVVTGEYSLDGVGPVKLEPIYIDAPATTAAVSLASFIGVTSAPPTFMGAAVAQLQAKVDEAEAIKQYVTDVSNIDTTVSAVDFALSQPGPAATLNAAIGVLAARDYATLVPVTRLGVSSALPNTDQTVVIQAAIDTGLPLYFPPGRYVASGLVPKSGMHLVGGGKGDPDNPTSPRTILRTVNGDLFAAGAPMCTIENMELQGAPSSTAGDLVTGDWSQGTFRGVRALQYVAAKRCFNVYGWIDMSIEGGSELLAPSATVTGACFHGRDASARIAQFAFRDTRVRGGNLHPAIHLEAYGGGLSLISSVTFDNTNFEVCNGGSLRLLSVRGVNIRGCGTWDLTANSGNPMIDIGEGGSGGAASGQITIDGWLRDATTVPGGGDIRATASTFGLNVLNPAHHNSSMHIYAQGASGRLAGTKATLHDGQNITTDFYQTYTPTVTATAIGNGTLTGRYKRTGHEIHAQVTLTVGSTTTIGSMAFSLPITPLTGAVAAIATDAGTAVYPWVGYLDGAFARVGPLVGGAVSPPTATTPFTWAPGDSVTVDVRYRVSA